MQAEDYDAFRTFLEGACGIVLGDNKHYLIDSRLNRIMVEEGVGSVRALIERMKDGHATALRTRIVDAMTTNETQWFRDNFPFELLRDNLLPGLARHRAPQLRIWSAACSTGQEPYSISMVLHEYGQVNLGALPATTQIVATDISPTVLRDAQQGMFDEAAIARGLSPERRQRYFQKKGVGWELRPEIRARVSFRELNLLQGYELLGRFEIIFCRNVLIYFSADNKRDIMARMARTLQPGGYLFLGASETVSGYSDDFTMLRLPGGIVYQRKA